MTNILYILVVICTHGVDNKQLLVDAFPHETLERCQVTENIVKRELAKDCTQLVTNCQKKQIIK